MSFDNPIWAALQTKHRHFALSAGEACRYPADVAPFAALREPAQEAMRELASLLTPGEAVWLVGDRYPLVPELRCEGTLECLQMALPEKIAIPVVQAERLTHTNAPEMVTLTDIAFPGFFRKRTCEMGSYFGVRHNGELIAMGGERLMLEGFAEISGLCTHPAHRGQGLATRLLWAVAAHQRRNGLASFLHVGCSNQSAIKLYLDLGFQTIGNVVLTRQVAA